VVNSSSKEIRRLIKQCEDEGLEVKDCGSGHFKIIGKGFVVTVSQTPKNAFTCVKQAKRDLRRHGVVL